MHTTTVSIKGSRSVFNESFRRIFGLFRRFCDLFSNRFFYFDLRFLANFGVFFADLGRPNDFDAIVMHDTEGYIFILISALLAASQYSV